MKKTLFIAPVLFILCCAANCASAAQQGATKGNEKNVQAWSYAEQTDRKRKEIVSITAFNREKSSFVRFVYEYGACGTPRVFVAGAQELPPASRPAASGKIAVGNKRARPLAFQAEARQRKPLFKASLDSGRDVLRQDARGEKHLFLSLRVSEGQNLSYVYPLEGFLEAEAEAFRVCSNAPRPEPAAKRTPPTKTTPKQPVANTPATRSSAQNAPQQPSDAQKEERLRDRLQSLDQMMEDVME